MNCEEFIPPQSAVVGPAFFVRDARAAGLSDYACRSARMQTPTSSVRTLTPFESPHEYAAAFAMVLPDDIVFSHVMAARIWGLPLPHALEDDKQVHVMRATGLPRVERKGCVPHKGLERRSIDEVGGLRVTSLPDTWLDLAEAFGHRLSISDLVMAGDAIVERLHPTKWVHDDHPRAPPGSDGWWSDPVTVGCAQLREALLRRRGHRGIRQARAALEKVRPRVWSPAESYSRLVVVDGGLPEPNLNKHVYLEDAGRLIGIGDLHWRDKRYRHKVLGEYQGEAKHTEGQASRASDNSRRLLLEDDGWRVIEIYKNDIFRRSGRAGLVARLGRLLGVA